MTPKADHDLVLTKDALVANVHFRDRDPAQLIAQKAMRVNLSDLAAMGARPIGYLLALALPGDMENIDAWVEDFSNGLKKGQAAFDWSLLGGDTVSTGGPLSLSLTAIGEVKRGRALRRDGAKAGDGIYVSGTLGDAALGLKCLAGEITPGDKTLIDRYHLPRPRLALGQMLHGVASAALDISDGLAGDIRHICAASGLGAEIEEKLIPLSAAAGKLLESNPGYKSLIWNGGDDYELLFTAPDHMAGKIRKISDALELRLTKIGRMTTDGTIAIQDDKGVNLLAGGHQGYRHF